MCASRYKLALEDVVIAAGSWPKEEGFGLVPRTKNDVGMNHLFLDILPVFCSTFSWLWSLGRVLFLSRLFGLVWVDAFLVEWIPFADFDDESKT